MGDGKTISTYVTDDVGLAAALLCQPGTFIVAVTAQPPKTAGNRPWCEIEVGCEAEDVLEDIVTSYERYDEGPLVPCRVYENQRRTIMKAIQKTTSDMGGR